MIENTRLKCLVMVNSKDLETLEIEDAGCSVEGNDVALDFCDNGLIFGNSIVEDQEVKVRKDVEDEDLDTKVGLKKCNAAGWENFPLPNCGFTDLVQMKTERFVEIEEIEEGKAEELENVDSSATEDICSFLSESSGISPGETEFLNVLMNQEISTESEGVMQGMRNGDKNKFSVGDIIWLRTKSQKWWPGKINNVVDNDQRDCFVVHYLGRNHITKRFAFQLKPFRENFKQLSQNIKSKGFLKSLKEAVNEFSVNYFVHDPRIFLSHIKSLASAVSAHDPLKLAATTNQLSAAYQFLGRYQIPEHQLVDPNTAHNVHGENVQFTELSKQSAENKEIYGKNRKRRIKEVEDNDSRSRKKSKYLSYPYINLEKKAVLESSEIHSLKSNSISKHSSLNFWRKWYHKFANGENMTSDPDLANASSVEFLSELHFAAMDLCYPKGNKNFDSIALFFSKFRMSMFHDESVYTVEDLTFGSNLIESEKKNFQPAVQTERKKRKQKSKGQASSSTSLANSENAAEINLPFLDGESLNMNVESPKIEAKGKKIRSKRSKTKSLSGLSDVDPSITNNPKQKKRKNDATASIPDLNGINSLSNFLPEDGHAMSSVDCQDNSRKKKRNKRDKVVKNPKTTLESHQPEPFFIDLQMVPQSIDELTQQNGFAGKERPSFILDFGQLTNSNSFEPEIGLKVQAESNCGDKKRKRQKKATSKPANTELHDRIPDLNGNAIESNPTQNETSLEPKPKRRRRKKGEGNITNDNQTTALHLTFSSSNDIPSKEDFITIFSRFGSLKESDINIMEDSLTARIIFSKPKDAGQAIQSLDKDNPFGAHLVKYQLLPDVASTTLTSPPLEDYMTKLKLLRFTPSSGEAPALEFIRQNLHMMTLLLEKSGTNLSPEMRGNLEDEIRGLLKKLSSTDGSSSA